MNNARPPVSTRSRRRIVLASIYGALALGIGASLAATPGRGGAAASRPATSPAANKAAAEAQFEKAKALYDKSDWTNAQIENEKALALDPANNSAILLKRVLATKITAGTEPVATSQTGPAGAAGRLPLLNTQQISMIRLMEMGNDERMLGKVDAKSLEDFWQNVLVKDPAVDKSKASHDAFVNPNNFPFQARRIREANDARYIEQITVTSDPAVVVAFRAQVHNTILQNCATSECHGGDKAGAFRLVNPAASPEQMYTNYYILSMYANNDGRMIDRNNPEKSLLLQYGLPWSLAGVKHPKVDVKKFPTTADQRYRGILDWSRGLGLTRPNYHVTYEIPGGPRAASAPATTAASATAPAK